MSTTPRIVADFESQLATAISIGSTTFDLSSVLDDDSVALPSGTYCFTIDNGSSVKEYLQGVLSGSSVSQVKSISRQGVATTGAARAHRVGASVIITDFIAIKRIADILAGLDALDGTSPLIYDTAPTLTDGKQVATVAYVLSVVTGGTVAFSSQIIQATAGETVAAPKVGYFKASDQRYWLADSATAATYSKVRLGIFNGSAVAGGGVAVQLSGIAGGFSGLTPGAKYYLGVAGAISTSAGLGGVLIGEALTSTTILLEFGTSISPTEPQKDFLEGIVGMIIPTGRGSAPSGFLLCDGSAVSRTTYAALFAAIGTSYGAGDGSTTFNVPDGRGRGFIGAGTGTNVASFDANTGVNTGTEQITIPAAASKWLITGQAVVLAGASLPTGLTAGTYYVILVDSTHIKLATTLANAQNDVPVNITAVGSGTATLTQTLTTRAAGDTGGEETHAISKTETLSHNHGAGNINSGGPNNTAFTFQTDSGDVNPNAQQDAIGYFGGNAAMNNMQPYFTGNWLIKT